MPMNIRLTPNFTLLEMLRSRKARELGIKNTPNAQQLINLVHLSIGMEKVRAFLGRSITPSSALRVLLLNREVKSKDSSAHIKGFACDFGDQWEDVQAVFYQIIESDIPYTKIILEYPDEDTTWIHIEFDPLYTGDQKEYIAKRDDNNKTIYHKVA